MFDVFVAELRCPSCHSVAPITADTGMQTHIRGDADSSSLGVGFRFDPRDLATQSVLDSGYALVRAPEPGGPIRLLDVWTCPACHTEQWAIVTIVDDTIQRIEAVALHRETLEAASFVSDVNAEILADSFEDTNGGSSVEILRRHLA
jgi:hypothetical protein